MSPFDPRKCSELAGEMLSQALAAMLLRYPMHAQWLSPRRWVERPAVGTMAVTWRRGQATFFYSPLFVTRCSPEELMGVVHHEINHLVMGHPFLVPSEFPNRHALLIAEEVTVNEYVDEPLPGNPLTLDQFPELPAGEDTLARYRRLEHRSDLEGLARAIDVHGWMAKSVDEGDRQMMEGPQRVLLDRLRNAGHDRAFARELLRSGSFDVDESLDIAGGAMRPLQRIDWRALISKLPGQRLTLEPSYNRPPRRRPELVGVVPGNRCQPERPRLMAAIDTSSSMQPWQFERIRYELRSIRSIAEVTVVECDKHIRRCYRLRGELQSIHGRGGTDFRPVLDRRWLQQHRSDMLVYFTDGDGPVPERAPSKTRMVWAIFGSRDKPTPWGEMIRLRR